jgi:hypothetical protein
VLDGKKGVEMRKKALKKKYQNRNSLYKKLREDNSLHFIENYNGNQIALNLKKHFIFGIPYKNEEYQSEIDRRRNLL